MRARPSLGSLCCVAAMLWLGCTDERGRWESELRARREAADASASAVALPRAPAGSELPTPSYALARLILAGGEVRLDRTPLPWESSYDDPADRALALASTPVSIATLVSGRVLLPGTVDDEGHDTHLPLGSELEHLTFRRRDLATLALLAEGATPGRAVGRTLGLLADLAGTTRAELSVSAAQGERRVVPLAVRRLSVAAASPWVDEAAVSDPEASDLALTIDVRADGLHVSSSGGAVEPGCRTVTSLGASPIAVPRVGDAIDADALGRCMATIHTEFPTEEIVHVHASADTTLETLVPLLVSIHTATSGSYLAMLMPGRLAPPPPPDTGLYDVLRGGTVSGSRADVLVPGS